MDKTIHYYIELANGHLTWDQAVKLSDTFLKAQLHCVDARSLYVTFIFETWRMYLIGTLNLMRAPLSGLPSSI